MSKPEILRIGKIFHAKAEWEALSSFATLLECDSVDRETFKKDLKDKYSNITAIYKVNSLAQTGRFDQELIDCLPKSLKFICHNGAGFDNTDAQPLKERGILFSNVVGATDRGTADVAFFMLLGCFRNLYANMQSLRAGKWDEQGLAHDPEQKTLGILGMGGIGRALATRARAFDMKIIYHNRSRLPDSEEGGAIYVSFETLLAQSDAISLNLPLNANTKHIFDKEVMYKCKKGVILINTARGPVMDEAALVEALEEGQVGNAGLDVFENEPEIHPGLLKNDKVFLLPHIGTATYESRYSMEMVTINNLKSALEKGVLETLIAEHKDIGEMYKK